MTQGSSFVIRAQPACHERVDAILLGASRTSRTAIVIVIVIVNVIVLTTSRTDEGSIATWWRRTSLAPRVVLLV